MGVGRRRVLGVVGSGANAVAAGCTYFRSVQSLSLGLVRVVNLETSPLDVRVVLSSADEDTAVQRAQTLQRFDKNDNSHADELVYRPNASRVVSDYDYSLYIDDASVMRVDGAQIVSRYDGEYDDESCLALHFYINDIEDDIWHSHELYDECALPS